MTTETPESPRSLGRYELVHLLGQGGMGEVYLAKISGAAGFEKPCIVKTILPTLMKDRQFLDRFHHEAKVLVHLVHSSIAQVYDMGEAHGTYFMALEYVAGVDVAYLAEQARQQGQTIPVPVALYLGQRIAEGLGYAHRKAGSDGTPLGIVHRDVSPHNVMVSYEGEVKVIDFGLAKSAARSKYTLPATVMGKLGYMSPEQARAEPLDHRSDIYSCGVVVWELLAGQPLVPHGTVGEMMAAMANPSVPALSALRPDVDPALDAVVRRALAPHPQDRYARADEFARALNEQLLRASASLGAEEVGNYVRALCPEAFSAQRQLISRISGVRRPPSTPPGTGVMATGVSPLPPGMAAMTGLEATSVRPLEEMQAQGMSATPRPLVSPVPGALVPAAVPSVPASGSDAVAVAASNANDVRRWKLLALGLGALLLVGASVGGTVYFLRGVEASHPSVVVLNEAGHPLPSSERGRPPPARMGPDGRPHHPRLGPDGRPLPPPHLGPDGRPLPPHLGEPMPPPHGEAPQGEPPEGAARWEQQGHPPPSMGSEKQPGGEPSSETIPAAGAEGSASTVPAVAAVGSAVAAPAVATQAPAKARPERPQPHAAPEDSTQWIQVTSHALPLRHVEKLRYRVPGGYAAGLREGMRVPVVGEGRPGRHPLLGFATVRRAEHTAAVVILDPNIRGASGARFVVPPTAAPPEAVAAPQAPAAPEPPAAPVPPRTLTGGVKRSSFMRLGVDKGLVIQNSDGQAWRDCKATLSGKRRLEIQLVRRSKSVTVGLGDFKHHVGAPELDEDKLLLECEQGTALFDIPR
ncbi:serine/threonine protein kinase [Hyalangium rubrum]|uniref:Protein kinase n=1 Tax=Hyalangium rubrum TaxID=3103134 RepID=A0ABU5H9W0_9BACT|nr:protein kinase [Hyalangium sp. s54d21]MDY7230258.1 protein kinase [Hyalangium sp. s54d21]